MPCGDLAIGERHDLLRFGCGASRHCMLEKRWSAVLFTEKKGLLIVKGLNIGVSHSKVTH